MAQQAFYTKINAGAGVQFSGGTIAQATAVLHTNNVLYLRGGSAGLSLQNADGSDRVEVGNDYVRIETNNTERLRVVNSGKIGIGTSNPSMALHVKAGDEATMVLESTTGEPAMFWAPGGTSLKWENRASASRWQLYQYDQSEWVFNIYDAKVGIGTVSPDTKLHVVTSGATNALKLYQATYQQFEFKYDNTYHSTMMFGHFGELQYDGNGGYLRIMNNSTQAGSHVSISTAGSERMRVTHDGKVGIGTSTPAALLDVTASSAPVFRMYRSGTGQVWTQEIDSSGRWQLREAASTGGTKYTRLQVDDPGNVAFSAYGSGSFTGTAAYNLQVDSSGNIIETTVSGSGTVTGSGTTNYIPMWSSSTALGNSIMYQTGSKVGIGTTSPTTKLEINADDNGTTDLNLLNLKRTWSSGTSTDRAHGIKFSDYNSTNALIYADRTNSGANYNSDLIFHTNTGASGTNVEAKMIIKNSGYVGIGTMAPATLVEIADTTNPNLRLQGKTSNGANSGTLEFRENDTNYGAFVKYNGDANIFQLGTRYGGSDYARMTILRDTGYVGINITNPPHLLTISGDSKYIAHYDGSNYAFMLGADSSGDGNFEMFNSSGTKVIKIYAEANSSSYINNGGNFGIGNNAPDYKLDVSGNIGIDDYLIHNGDSDTKIGFNTDNSAEIRVGGNLQINADASRSYLRYQGTSKLYTDSAGVIMDGYIIHTGDTNTYFGFPGNDVIQFNVGGDEELYIKSAGDSANYPANIVYTDHNFQVGLDGGKHIGNRINYATSQGWVEDAAPTANQAGYYGGNFNLNGASTENQLGWGKNPWDARALIWTSINDSSSNADGGWNKNISGLPGDNYAYMSIVYVKKNGSETSNTGSFYHGCSGSHTLNLDGNANTNPYFQSTSVNNLPDDVWCVSIGIIQANSDANTTTSGLIGGIYRLDTGQKVQNATTFKMKSGSTAQTHRTYLYYSTNTNNNLSWYAPGFYVVDGTEPTLAELVYATSGTNGSGTPNKISKWQDANTLTDSQLSDDGTNVTSSVPIRILDSLAANNPMLTLYNDTNGGGASIWFSDQATSAAQKGYLTFYHSDGASQGGGSTFQFLSTEADMTLQVGGAGKSSRVVVWSANSQTEVDYGFADDVNTGMTRLGADQVSLVAGALQGVYVSTSAVSLKYAGSTKISTTNTGVDVTGNMVASGDVKADTHFTSSDTNVTLSTNADGTVFLRPDGKGSTTAQSTFTTALASIGTDATFAGQLTIPEHIYHTGDPNSYFGFNANDTWRVVTGGSQRLDINNNGVRIGGGERVTTILDEDDMASNSDTALATQQSIKAYVDTSITGSTTFRGTWDPDVSLNSGYGNPNLNTVTKQDGYYYICSANGAATPNGTGTEPDSWHTGDWVVYNSNLTGGAAWQKIDNTSVISGAGTGQKVVKWDGSGTSETIADGPITFSGNNSTFAGNITMANPLTIQGGSAQIILEDTSDDDDHSILFRSNVGGDDYKITTKDFTSAGLGDGIFMGSEVSEPLGLATNDTLALTIDGSQNIGIGTTSPQTKLHVVGPDSNGSAVTLRVGGINNNNTSRLELVESTTNSSADMNYGFSFTADGNNSNDLLIRNHDNNIGGNVSISIQRGNGYVGINQSHASEPLDVNGTARMNSGIVEGTLYAGDSVQHWGDGGTGMYFNTDEIYFNTAGTTALTINSSQNVSFEGNVNLTDYQSGTVTTRLPRLKNVVVESNPETKNEFVHPYLLNDLANFKARGGTITFGGLSSDPTTSLNEPFSADAQFLGVANSVISGSTWTITLTSTGDGAFHLNYGCTVGICFGSSSFAPSSCKIEINDANDGSGTWTTVLDSDQRDTMYVGYNSTGGSGARAIRFTLGKYTGSDPRITNIFAYNYSSQGMTKYFLPLEGGKIYGTLNTAGNRIINIGTPTATTDATTKAYVDNAVSGAGSGVYLPLSAGISYPLTGDLYLDDGSGASPSIYLKNGSDNYWRLLNGSTGILALKEGTTDRLTFAAGGDATFWGELNVGTDSPSSNGNYGTGDLNVENDTFASAQIMSHSDTVGNFSFLGIGKSNGTGASPTIVQANETVGIIGFYGYDGGAYRRIADIRSKIDGTPGASDMPGNLEFYTTADGAASPTKRLTIGQDGNSTFTSNVTAQGYLQSYGFLYLRNKIQILNKAGNGWLDFASRDTSGSEALYNLLNVGTITTAGDVTFAGQLTVNGGTKLSGGDLQVTTDSTYLSNYNYTFRDAVGINNPNDTSAATSSTTVMAIGAKSGGTLNTSLITTGAVGVGIADPTSTLHVSGTSNITGNATFGGDVLLGTGKSIYLSGTSGLRLLHDGSNAHIINGGTGDLNFKNDASDKDIYFTGTDGSTAVTALTLDMSEGGNATFSGDILTNTDSSSDIGKTGDRWANIWVDNINGATPAVGANYLPLSGGTMTGNVTFNDNVIANFGTSNDLQIFHNSSNDRSYILDTVGDLYIENSASAGDIKFIADNKAGGTMEYFRVDGGASKVIASVNFDFLDNKMAAFGNSQDLQIYHDGSNSKIKNTEGHLKIGVSSRVAIQNDAYDENIAEFIKDGAVNLYYDNSSRLSTAADGIIVGGVSNDITFVNDSSTDHNYLKVFAPDTTVNALGVSQTNVYIPLALEVDGVVTLNNNLQLQDSDKIQIGNSQDLEIYHSSGTSKIDNNTGHLYIKNNVDNDDGSNIYIQAKSGENSIICNDDGAVQLYYNNSVKFYTGSSGVGAVGYYGFGSAGTSTGSSYYFRYGSVAAGATQGLIISTSDTGGAYFDGVAQFRNTNTSNGANMFQMINYGNQYSRYINFFRGSTSNIIGYIGYNATNTAVTYSTSSSDIRTKKNIVDWSEDVLPKFLALTPKKFHFKAAVGDKGTDKVKGFIAQYETENFPEVYQLNGEGQEARYGFHPMEMIPYLMKAVKELAEKNQDLERRLAALEK